MFLQTCLPIILLALLWPMPGVSQFGVNFGKQCRYTQMVTCPSAAQFKTYVSRVKSYEVCPDNHFIKLVFPKGSIYGEKTDGWVRDIMHCIDIGTDSCLSSVDFGFKNYCPQEAKDKPVPTALPRTSTKPQTTSYEQPPLEASSTQPGLPVTPEDHSVTPGDPVLLTTGMPRVAENRDQSSEKQENPIPLPANPDVGLKMKNLTVAVVSLILICLVLVAVITAIYCRTRKKKKYQRAADNETDQYENGYNLENTNSRTLLNTQEEAV